MGEVRVASGLVAQATSLTLGIFHVGFAAFITANLSRIGSNRMSTLMLGKAISCGSWDRRRNWVISPGPIYCPNLYFIIFSLSWSVRIRWTICSSSRCLNFSSPPFPKSWEELTAHLKNHALQEMLRILALKIPVGLLLPPLTHGQISSTKIPSLNGSK